MLEVIRSLPDPKCTQMNLLVMYSKNVQTFKDISRHLELEVECIEMSHTVAYVAQVEKCESFEPRQMKQRFKAKGLAPKKG